MTKKHTQWQDSTIIHNIQCTNNYLFVKTATLTVPLPHWYKTSTLSHTQIKHSTKMKFSIQDFFSKGNHIRNLIDIKAKSISFIKQFSCKFSIMEFYWNFKKSGFIQLICIDTIVIIFKIIIIESAKAIYKPKNIWIYKRFADIIFFLKAIPFTKI